MTTTPRLAFADMPTRYADLVAMRAPRPLRDVVDERDVEEIVEALAGHELTPDQSDYLDVLSDILLAYQARQREARGRRLSPSRRLKYLLEQSGTTPARVAELVGCSQPLISLILAGKRNVTAAHARKLSAHFRLDAGYFL